MKIRTQLILACLVLAILPLTGIVLYSYHSSRRALEMAYRQEAQRLAQQMDRRMAAIRAELDERLANLSSIPLPASPSATDRTAVVDNMLTVFGDTASLIDAVEFIPARAPTPPQPTPQANGTHPAPQIAAMAHVSVDHQAITEPIVIDLPPVIVPRFEMTPTAQKAMAEVSTLSADLGANATKMSKEQREAKRDALREKSELLEREVEASRTKFQEQMKVATQQSEERKRRIAVRMARTPTKPIIVTGTAETKTRRDLSPHEKARLRQKERQTSLLFGRSLNVSVQKEGEVVGQIRAKVSSEEVIRRILGAPTDDRNEIPFAIDRDGNLYARTDNDRRRLEGLGVPQRVRRGQSLREIENWVVAMTRDEESGLRVGVVRPVGRDLIELKQTAARNFGYGVGLIAFALIGIVPLANHFTRDVLRVTEGAQRISQGDLQTRLPVRGKDEFGQLALAFNRMAADLSEHQRRQLQQRALEVEYERKSVELEDARRFQLSLLPKTVPQHDEYDIAVLTQTATEVGGDYYDFHASEEGGLSITIGDATGHGAKAGTMVTVIKTLFAGYDSNRTPAEFLRDAAEKIKRMDLGRMAMALLLARFDRTQITIASAGMPPLLVHRRRSNRVEEVTLPATPLGTLGMKYEQTSIAGEPGDTVLFMTDGLPELQNAAGQQLGYPQAMQEFATAAESAKNARDVIDALAAAAARWHGDLPPNDDITFVVVRMQEESK
jgi:serine phosphatase RsbU (regulator of sigma subunit)